MKFSLRQLEIFCAIAEQGNMSAAAKKIFLSQSAASMALADLEQQLNKALFDRIGKRLALNEDGKLLLPKAQALISQAEQLETLLKNKPAVLSGKLVIGASTTIGNYLLPQLVARFIQRYPKVLINLVIHNSDYIIAQLQKTNIDAGIIEGQCYAQDIQQTIWQHDELVLVVGRQHTLAKKAKVNIKDLQSAEWILREQGSGTRGMFEQTFAKHLSSINVKLELPSNEAIKQVLVDSHLVSCLSIHTIQQELKNKSLIRLKVPGLQYHRKLLLLTHKNKQASYLLQEFIEFINAAKILEDIKKPA